MTEQEAYEGIIEKHCEVCIRYKIFPAMCESECMYKQALIAIEKQKKLDIVLSSLDAEAEFCHQVADYMENDEMYEAAGRMKVKEEAFRDCISMIKEELRLK